MSSFSIQCHHKIIHPGNSWFPVELPLSHSHTNFGQRRFWLLAAVHSPVAVWPPRGCVDSCGAFAADQNLVRVTFVVASLSVLDRIGSAGNTLVSPSYLVSFASTFNQNVQTTPKFLYLGQGRLPSLGW
jgi:hypothetical protein